MHGHVSKWCWSASAVISHWKFNLSTALSFCCTLFCLQPILRNVASACGSTVSDFFLRSLQFVFGPTPQTCFWIYRKGLICFRNFIAASYSKIVLWLAQITDQFIRCRLLLIEIQKLKNGTLCWLLNGDASFVEPRIVSFTLWKSPFRLLPWEWVEEWLLETFWLLCVRKSVTTNNYGFQVLLPAVGLCVRF